MVSGLLALLALVAPSMVPGEAYAEQVGCYEKEDLTTGTVTVICPKSKSTPGDNSKNVKPPPPTCRDTKGKEIPCTTEDGYWHAIMRCYLKQDSSRDGWICTSLDGTRAFVGEIDAPAPPPDPRHIAWQLVAQAQLRAGQIGLVPDSEHALLGMPTWLWIDDPGPATTGPITRSTTVNGYTVTIEARLARVVYDMGDGSTVACVGSRATGTVYLERYGLKPSPTCGHVYQQPGTYTVTARSSWAISWYGVGQAGSLTFTLQRSLETTVREGHVVTR